MTGPLRVLLVEDDTELRATLRETLEVEGYRVQPAASAADARALWTHAQGEGGEGAFDLVLLDLGLPDADGSSLLALFTGGAATGASGRRAPVVVISARHDDGRKIALLDAGADDYLVKPFGVGELLARLRVALRHRGIDARPAVTRYEVDGL